MNYNLKESTKKFEKEVSKDWSKEMNSTNYQRWQRTRCLMTIPDTVVKSWDI